jgi:hypothetical protein
MTSPAENDQAVERDFTAPETHAAVAALSATQRAKLHQYWLDRASGELTTALTFEFMHADLQAEGAPAELITLADRAISDEHRHVDWCMRWARLVDGAHPGTARLGGTRPLEFEGASPRDNRLLRTVFGCCFSETAAVHVLRASHRLITVGSVRRLNREHMREEVGHAQLGWALAAWPGLSARDRGMLAAYVPEMTRLTRELWLSTPREGDPELHALGYLSSAVVEPAVTEALDEVTLPGLSHLGVEEPSGWSWGSPGQ